MNLELSNRIWSPRGRQFGLAAKNGDEDSTDWPPAGQERGVQSLEEKTGVEVMNEARTSPDESRVLIREHRRGRRGPSRR